MKERKEGRRKKRKEKLATIPLKGEEEGETKMKRVGITFEERQVRREDWGEKVWWEWKSERERKI